MTDQTPERPRSALRSIDPDSRDRLRDQHTLYRAEIAAREAQKPALAAAGEAALRRLLPVAQRDTGQSGVVARFLLGLYNGSRFPFDLTDLRRLDYALFDDCMAVLAMDCTAHRQEVHLYFPSGGKLFEQLAEDWNVRDFHGENWRSKAQP
ncbi:MAG: DUF7673 family protein [Telluria sp.]